jgi:phosphoadenosine phosphosulfate reductase
VRKIEPLERALEDYDAWMTGIRREQTPQRANTKVVAWEERYGAAKIAPLAFMTEEWAHEYVAEHDVPVNPLLERGYKSIGCEPQTRPVAPDEDPRAGAGRGSRRPNAACTGLTGRSYVETLRKKPEAQQGRADKAGASPP